MLRFSAPVTLRLERGQLIAWPRQSGVRLRVVQGTAWVTQADDAEDHFLQPGQLLDLRTGSRALISAEQDAALHFESGGGLNWAGLGRRVARLLSSSRSAPTPASATR